MRRLASLLLLLWLTSCSAPLDTVTAVVSVPIHKLTTGDFPSEPDFEQELLPEKVVPEPLFLTSLSVSILDEQGRELPSSGSLAWWELCWVNRSRHAQLLGREAIDAESLARLPGEPELRYPDGYGLPLWSNEPLVFRGAWSSQVPSNGREVRLALSFSRNLELKPLLAMSSWAGRNGAADPDSCQAWQLSPGAEAKSSYILPKSSQVVLQRWFLGPGIGPVQESSEAGADGASIRTFESTVKNMAEPTALGVTLYLADPLWSGDWPSSP